MKGFYLIEMYAYIKKSERPPNNLILHFKELEKRNKLKPNIIEENNKNQSRDKQNKYLRNNGKDQQN